MAPVRIYSTSWCSDCRRAKQFLKERGVQFEEINVDESPDAEDLVIARKQRAAQSSHV